MATVDTRLMDSYRDYPMRPPRSPILERLKSREREGLRQQQQQQQQRQASRPGSPRKTGLLGSPREALPPHEAPPTLTIPAPATEIHAQPQPVRSPALTFCIESLRLLLSSIYLCYIVLTIPLSFEIGGLDCGLSYSLTILLLYFSLATLRLLHYHRFISTFLYYMQHLLLPSVLSFFLTVYEGRSGSAASTGVAAQIWNALVSCWKLFLINSTPLFTILEGFCSLLSIQAIGQVSQFLIRYRSDSWSIVNLIISSCILLASLTFMVKIYVSPSLDLTNVGMVSASLLGSVFTCTALVTVYGVSSGRASPLECALLFAYIVKCAYELFPELSRSNFSYLFKFVVSEFKNIDSQANLMNRQFFNSVHDIFRRATAGSNTPQLLTVLYSKTEDFFVDVVWRFVVENWPRSFEPLWDFFKISLNNLTVPILLQLAYRITVFFAATKIIPVLQPIGKRDSPLSTPKAESPVNDFSSSTSSNASTAAPSKPSRSIEDASTSSRLVYLYSPCIIIAVYTNLMIQYNDDLDKQNHFWNWVKLKVIGEAGRSVADMAREDVHSWQFWHWVNIFSVLALYLSELYNHDPEESLLYRA